MSIKPIETYYNGCLFRSRLEARWAVFFDACGVKWEYEPEGYDLGNGIWYLPDFLLHDVVFNHAAYSRHNDLYVEVKGVMTADDALKIKKFSEECPILVVGEIPKGEEFTALCEDMSWRNASFDVVPFNFETVDGDYFGAFPGVDLDGDFELFGDDCSYLDAMDTKLTAIAYRKARCARFEHGDHVIAGMRRK